VGVRNAPEELPESDLAAVLAREWGIDVAELIYRPVGFGSHHWEVLDAGGTRWFATVDDLATRRLRREEPLAAPYQRLRGCLATAREVRDYGRGFVVAPVPTRDGEPLAPVSARYAAALHPHVEGRSFDWGEFTVPTHREATLAMIVAVHTAPDAARRHARVEDFAIPHRDELTAALAGPAGAPDCGPYAGPAAELLAAHGAPMRRLLRRYDDMVARWRAAPGPTVLTHGEPHPGNTMLGATGEWLLIDWDTVLVAPPERDLWHLDEGDGAVLAAYARATGVTPNPSTVELYRLGWDLKDVAMDVGRFRRPHPGDANDDASWRILTSVVTHLSE